MTESASIGIHFRGQQITAASIRHNYSDVMQKHVLEVKGNL